MTDFREMVTKIREVESILGNINYSIPQDVKVDYRGRRSLYFSKNLSKDEIITTDSVAVVRPSLGLHPKYRSMLLNKQVNVDVKSGDRVQFELIKDSKIKVLIIGLGAIGVGFGWPIEIEGITNHLSYLMNDERFTILCGVDPSDACRLDFMKKTGLEAYPTLLDCEDLLEQSDIIILSDSSASRAKNFVKLSEKFKNKIFLLEKPIATNLNEALEMFAAVAESGNKVFVNYQRRVNPSFKFLKKLLENEASININCRHSGSYLNIGTHFLDLFLYFTGDYAFFRSNIINSGIRIFESNGHRLVLEEIKAPEYYTMSIVSETYTINIDFNDGEVKVVDCRTSHSTNFMLDNTYYFQYVGDELINLYSKNVCCFTSFQNSIKYLEV